MTTYKNFEFDSLGAKLAGYEWHVSDPKAAVYLIHGIGEHAGRYEHVARFFNDAGIAMMAMDLRGHGRSPGKRGCIGYRCDVLKDVDNLSEEVKKRYPNVPLINYGHSLGGNIALEYRLRGKLSGEPAGYLITSPWIKLVRPISGGLYHAVKLGSRIMPKACIPQNIDNKMLGDIKLIEQEADSNLRHQKISLQTAVQGFDVATELVENRIPDKYGGGEKPMLLMHGSEDPICDVEGSRKIAKNYGNICEYVEWEGYLHELHNGTGEKSNTPILKKMVSWIDSVLP